MSLFKLFSHTIISLITQSDMSGIPFTDEKKRLREAYSK